MSLKQGHKLKASKTSEPTNQRVKSDNQPFFRVVIALGKTCNRPQSLLFRAQCDWQIIILRLWVIFWVGWVGVLRLRMWTHWSRRHKARQVVGELLSDCYIKEMVFVWPPGDTGQMQQENRLCTCLCARVRLRATPDYSLNKHWVKQEENI